jgi:hypothetical protein
MSLPLKATHPQIQGSESRLTAILGLPQARSSTLWSGAGRLALVADEHSKRDQERLVGVGACSKCVGVNLSSEPCPQIPVQYVTPFNCHFLKCFPTSPAPVSSVRPADPSWASGLTPSLLDEVSGIGNPEFRQRAWVFVRRGSVWNPNWRQGHQVRCSDARRNKAYLNNQML